MGREPGEDGRDQGLAVDVAAGVAVGDQIEGGLILGLSDEATLQGRLNGRPRAVGNVEALLQEAAPKMLSKELHRVFKLLNPAAVDHVADKLREPACVEGDRRGEPIQSPGQVFPA